MTWSPRNNCADNFMNSDDEDTQQNNHQQTPENNISTPVRNGNIGMPQNACKMVNNTTESYQKKALKIKIFINFANF